MEIIDKLVVGILCMFCGFCTYAFLETKHKIAAIICFILGLLTIFFI